MRIITLVTYDMRLSACKNYIDVPWRLLQRLGFTAQDWCADTTLKTSVSHNFQFGEVGREIKGVAQGHAAEQWHSWEQKPLSES